MPNGGLKNINMDQINREHILAAIEEIDREGIRPGRNSSTYDVIHEGKPYPPKLVISIANRFATGEELDSSIFSGGMDTPAFQLLKKEGFEIVSKRNDIQDLIRKYKKHILQTQLKDEKYKWELLHEFKGRPNIDAPDLLEEFKSIKYTNLIYAMGIAVLYHLLNAKPEEMRSLFRKLFDESNDLTQRIKSFNIESLALYRSLGETLQHHQDERTIASYLTFYNPEKYTFYKYSFYKKLCGLLNEKEAKKNEKYPHYLQLIHRLIEEYIQHDIELIELVKSYIPEYYDGSNNLLLTQDILYQMLDKNDDLQEINAKEEFANWFIANDGKISNYYSKQFGSKKERLIEELDLYEQEYKENFNTELFIIDTNDFINQINIIKINIYDKTTEFSKFSEKRSNDRPRAILGKNNYLRFLLERFSQQQTINYWIFQGNPKFYDVAGALQDDVLTTWKVAAHKDKIRIGDKVILWISGEDSGCYALAEVTSEVGKIPVNVEEIKYYKSDYDENEDRVSIEIEHNYFNSPILWKTIKEDGVFKDFKGGNQGTNFTATKEQYEALLDLDSIKSGIDMGKINNRIIQPLNQILYGPPGTGKTFELQNAHFHNFTIRETALTREQYLESVVADLTWWQVISIAVLDLGKTKVNDIVNHELIKIKEKLSSSKTVRPTIWGQLQSHTVMECPFVNVSNRSEPLYFSKSEDSLWTIDEKLLEDYYPEGKKILAISKNYKPSNDTLIKNYDFVTFHQSFSYEDFVEGIKPRLDEGETEVAFEIKDGIFKKLCIKAEADPKNNYAIFIDEINRGNVSAIFGELITLIEDDKRLGSTNELKVKLPYSKRELGVPSNLYIIGTMNTADRSVEALDTALRRRFSFSEIMPNPALLEEIQFNDFNLAEVLKTINERIEVLLDRDHTIGHSYFLKIRNGDVGSLKSVFKNNIFPLLQEYFYHDYEKIALILGEGFVRVKKNQTVKFAKFNDINTPDIGTQFELIDKIEDIEGAVHLLLNRNV